jgi:hypothetical protein
LYSQSKFDGEASPQVIAFYGDRSYALVIPLNLMSSQLLERISFADVAPPQLPYLKAGYQLREPLVINKN